MRNLLSLSLKYLFMWSVPLYVTYILLSPPLHGCPTHLSQALTPWAGLPSYSDTCLPWFQLALHWLQHLHRDATSSRGHASHTVILTCVDTCLARPHLMDLDQIAQIEKRKNKSCVPLWVCLFEFWFTYLCMYIFIFGCVRKAAFEFNYSSKWSLAFWITLIILINSCIFFAHMELLK